MRVAVWAVIYPEGRILADSDFETERDAWEVALGWPDTQEIDDAKRAGYRAVELLVELPEEQGEEECSR